MNNIDIERLRNLAKKTLELSNSQNNIKKIRDWTCHNDLNNNSRGMVFCDPENGWNEIILQKDLLCNDPFCRNWEFQLLRDIYSCEVLKDDKVLDANIYINNYHQNSGWGITSTHNNAGINGAYQTNPALDDYSKLKLMKYPKLSLDKNLINEITDKAHDIFDGILNVKYKSIWWWSLGLSNTAIDLRGLENFMMDMYDYPDELHNLMNFLCEGNLQMLDYLEKEDMLTSNIGNHYVGSGGFGFTNDLKFKENNVKTQDIWGFCESQETSSVSTEMFKEFVFPYQLKIAKRFGLNCYGCCEGLDRRFEVIKEIPNLRRVSVSHWANAKKMAEYLGDKYIYSLKPSPSYLAVKEIDEISARNELKEKISYAKANNCHIEVIMKDNHTLGGNPHNAIRWVEIAKEELDII